MLAFQTPAVERPLKISAGNSATQVQSGWWNWTVFIEGSEDVLRSVRCVEYTLHPTFPDPVRTVCSRGTGREAFPLSSSGWGTFQIGIRVVLKDGRIQELTHHLRF
jgi:transcription initiation factor IIF auxiliary subunit